jgi:quercetin dioxygenase-like cupin family protein
MEQHREDRMVRAHEPGESVFRAILPEDIEWKPFPAFPPSARLAVLVGEPTKAGPYVVRVRLPHGEKLMPHRHPEDRVYTVISGVFHIGLGEQFDAEKLQAFPPGSVIVLPGDTWHFHWAKTSEYITQVTAVGPLGLEYHDVADDPRHGIEWRDLDLEAQLCGDTIVPKDAVLTEHEGPGIGPEPSTDVTRTTRVA